MSEDKEKLESKKGKKDLEVVSGNGKDLDISPVYEHLSSGKPKTSDKKPKHIIVPKTKKDSKTK